MSRKYYCLCCKGRLDYNKITKMSKSTVLWENMHKSNASKEEKNKNGASAYYY